MFLWNSRLPESYLSFNLQSYNRHLQYVKNRLDLFSDPDCQPWNVDLGPTKIMPSESGSLTLFSSIVKTILPAGWWCPVWPACTERAPSYTPPKNIFIAENFLILTLGCKSIFRMLSGKAGMLWLFMSIFFFPAITSVEDPGSGIQCCFNHWIIPSA